MKIQKMVLISLFLLTLVLVTNSTVNADNSTDTGNVTLSKTYTDLNIEINDTVEGDVLILDDNYTYDSQIDTSSIDGVNISKNITIKSKGDSFIDGRNTARCCS